MTAVLTAIRRVLVGTGSTAFTLVGALLIGFGVPLFWIFVASQFYGKTGAVNGPVAAFIGTGILVSEASNGTERRWTRRGTARPVDPQHARHALQAGRASE